MVLTFTGSLSVADAGRDDVRTMLIGALGCNLAWGIIDAMLYLMGCLADSGQSLTTYLAVRRATDPQHAQRRIADALPPVVASILEPAELETIRQRLMQLPEPPERAHLSKDEWMAFARRTFVEGPDGRPVLNYDPAIAAALGQARPVPKWVLWRLFTRLAKRPTLLIRGGSSDLIDETIAAKMRARAPQMSYAEVPGVGHAPMLNEPAAKAAIETFLSAQP